KRAAKAALAARTRHVLLASFEAGRPGACASGSSRFESPRARPRAWSYGLGGAPAVLALSCGSLLGDVEITGHEQEQQQEEEAPRTEPDALGLEAAAAAPQASAAAVGGGAPAVEPSESAAVCQEGTFR